MHTDYASTGTIFKLAITINLVSVIWNIISDCDETYNYWEPLHFVIYGKGFQTWEYSPIYSLRSYLYLILFGWPAILLNYVFKSISKRFLFYLIRTYMAIVISWLEMDLYKSFRLYLKNFDEFMIPIYSLLILMLSAGSFIASTAFLPSSFAFYCSILTLSSWLKSDYNVLIASVAASAILGWPFSAAVGVPFAIDLLFFQRKLAFFIKYSMFWGFIFTGASIIVDSWFYGQITFPSLNIIFYNVFASHGGPELYGVESGMFYVKNYILNFNIATILVLISFPAALCYSGKIEKTTRLNRLSILSIGVLFVWNLIFFSQAHKEERFLFPCYPFVAVTAGICLFHCQTIFNHRFSWAKLLPKQTISTGFLVVFSCISASRILAIILSYNAPISLYSHLNDIRNSKTTPTNDKLLCLGREWHRFPSSFLVPTFPSIINVSFIRSDFKGQLPGKYNHGNMLEASRDVNQRFNDRNQEEESRYVDVMQCDFIVDRIDNNNRTSSANEPNWEMLTTNRWRSILKYRLLNPSSSVGSRNALFRSFYLPFVFEKYNQFVDYVVLEKSIL